MVNKGNDSLPDFKQLNDRFILEPSSSPRIVIKTNLDPKDPTDKNPYVQGFPKDRAEFSNFFNEG